MPPKKDHPRNEPFTVSITALDRAALEDASAKRGKSAGTIAYEMMQRGNLISLVESFVASMSDKLPDNTD